MNQTFKIDTGGDSPFQVFDGAGNIMFDARYASMRVEQVGSVSMPGNGLYNFTIAGTTSWVDVMLTRNRGAQGPAYNAIVFGGGPYSSTAARFASPQFIYSPNGLGGILFGAWTNGLADRLRFGNQNQNDAVGYYAILSNSIG